MDSKVDMSLYDNEYLLKRNRILENKLLIIGSLFKMLIKLDNVIDTLEKSIQRQKNKNKHKENIDKKPQIIIRLNKEINKYWIPESKLVLKSKPKSKEDLIIIGNYNNTLNKLTVNDIAFCEKYDIRYEK
jgi:hypothetical protein